jgi:pseudouridine-5'-monophosphatase
MQEIVGTSNRVLEVDLTARSFGVYIVSETERQMYLGGKGLGLKLVYDRLAPGVDPLGADNILAFMPGVLMGTGAPCSGRFAAVTKSPLTGLIGTASCGGPFGMALKTAVTHVIFDMDGVLLDTENYYTEVTQRIVERFGKRFSWSVKSRMMGRSPLVSARILVEALELPITPEQYLYEREGMLEELAPGSEPMPGAVALVQSLHAARVPLGLATSSHRRMYELKTQRHRSWFALFSAVVLGDDPRIKAPKPAPDIFLLAAEDLGAEPSQCLVVEDSPAGVQAARAAGMQVVAVPYPGLDPETLGDADLLVTSLEQLDPTVLNTVP